MIGTTAAILLAVSAGAQAGTSIYNAKKQTEAADKALGAQLKSSDRSADLMAQEYRLAQQRMAPYQDLGNMGAQNLAQMLRAPNYQPFAPGMPNGGGGFGAPQQAPQPAPWSMGSIPPSILQAQPGPAQIAPGTAQGINPDPSRRIQSLGDLLRPRR